MTGRKKTGRWLGFFVSIVLLLACALCVSGAWETGEVLYHQDFSVISSASAAGVLYGGNTEGGEVAVRGDDLVIRGHDAFAVYALLPETEPYPDSYTVEFTFRFEPREEDVVSNRYISLLLSASPENLSGSVGVRIRANGRIELEDPRSHKSEFGVLSEENKEKLLRAVQTGDSIHVSVPVEDNRMRSVRFTVDGESFSCHREEDFVLPQNGRIGFLVRNAYAAVEEVWVVAGVDYTEKTGTYAAESWRDDGKTGPEDPPYAPPTGDAVPGYLLIIAAGLLIGFVIRKKR